ncbi:hypothetical protein KIN20_024519 [Parelaphostrongylus tenuis]|uniref:Uncharacterized protein n=1 Tax=Parelaphostrongylus tenuis TaxID=148309 RepID=A0AAD5NCV7_PARTN|nr:hypothetical protein KIN20_024519 [Parelaphostrongylus tenuis]
MEVPKKEGNIRRIYRNRNNRSNNSNSTNPEASSGAQRGLGGRDSERPSGERAEKLQSRNVVNMKPYEPMIAYAKVKYVLHRSCNSTITSLEERKAHEV